MWYIIGFEIKTKTVKINPKIEQIIIPFDRMDFVFLLSFNASLSAIKGVIAVENPIPKDIAKNTKLFPSDIAANSDVPNWPTIALSTNPTNVWPIIPIMTGYASFRLNENSLV